MAMLKKAVQTSSTRDSRALAGEIIQKINSGEVVLSPEQEMQLYGKILEQTTLDDVNGAVRALWGNDRRLIEIVGVLPQELEQENVEQLVLQAWQAVSQTPVSPWVQETSGTFPYLFPPVESVLFTEEQDHPAIGVQSYTIAQGVRLHLKPTKFQSNQVMLSVDFGHGKLGQPRPGMALLAQNIVNESGLGLLSQEQLESKLAGANLELGFKIGAESFSFAGSGLRGEFERMLQLVYHHLKDPAFREEAFQRSRDSLERMYRQLGTMVTGVQQTQGDRYLAGTRPEYTLAPWDEVAEVPLTQIEYWLKPVFADAPLEINVVGDIDPEQALHLVSKYFGHEKRVAQALTQKPEPDFPFGTSKRIQVASSIDKTMLTVAWKTDDFWNISRTRRLSLLAGVLDDRLRVKIREELGATYSPQVSSEPSRAHAGFGLLRCNLIVAPQQAENLEKVIKEVAANLAQQGVQEEELQRAIKPTLTSIKDIKEDNRYWMQSVLQYSDRHPQQLKWPVSILPEYAAITADELTALARQYLKPELAATVIISPSATE